jgi:hypothetical protein
MKGFYEKRWLTKPFHRLSEFSVGYENDTGPVVAETMVRQMAISDASSRSRLAYHISALRRAEWQPYSTCLHHQYGLTE